MKFLWKWIKNIWSFLSNDKLFNILFSFLLLYGVGYSINAKFQTDSWKREVAFQLLKSQVTEDRKTIAGITFLIEARLFESQQVFWALSDNKAPFPEKSWEEYRKTVDEWNKNLETYRIQLVYLLGNTETTKLITYPDDLKNEIPLSIHYKFFRLNENLVELRKCYYSRCDMQKYFINAQNLIKELIDQKEEFSELLNKRLNDDLSKFITSPTSYIESQKVSN